MYLPYSVCVGDSAVQHSLWKFHVKHCLVRVLSQLPVIPHCDADLNLLVGTSDFYWFGKSDINSSTRYICAVLRRTVQSTF